MSSEHEHSAAEFARRLVTLTPAATLTRDQVLYEAGRNAGRKEARPWRFTASVMTVGMIGLLSFETWNGTTSPMAWKSSQPIEVQRQEQVAQTVAEPTTPSLARIPDSVENADYLRLRDLLLQRGVDAMPRPTTASATPNKTGSTPPIDGEVGGAWWRLRVKQLGGASL